MPEYRETIKRLDRQIADLWRDHRAALAAPYRSAPAPREADPVIRMDYFYHADLPVESSAYQIKEGGRWRSVDDQELSELISRYVADVPLEDPDDLPTSANLPLRDVLKRRGLTLRYKQIRGGSGYHYLSPL